MVKVEDYASAAMVLYLAPSSTVTKIMSLDSLDLGNQLATVFCLIFMRF